MSTKNMIALFSGVAIAAAWGLKPQSYGDKSLLLKEAVNLVHSYTTMTVFDAKDFEDQAHLLVDDIPQEFDGEFDFLMGQLAQNGHVSLVSASSAGSNWPLEPTIASPGPTPNEENNNSVSHSGLELETRKESCKYVPRYILTYSDYGCGGIDYNGRYILHPAECLEVDIKDVKSVYLYNPLNYSMHVAVYRDPCCNPRKRAAYHWHMPLTHRCYCVRTGYSMWWDWPHNNAP